MAGGRPAAAGIAAVGWVGLSIQLYASTAQVGSVAAAIWTMLRYFTVIANLLAAVVLTGIAIGAGWAHRPIVLGGVTLAMLLVGIVYAALLSGLLSLSGGAALADVLLHRATPVLVPLYWLGWRRRGVRVRDPLIWALLPVGYFAYALARASFDGVCPYPFMNVARIGWGGVLAYAAAMAAGFLIVGYAMRWLDAQGSVAIRNLPR